MHIFVIHYILNDSLNTLSPSGLLSSYSFVFIFHAFVDLLNDNVDEADIVVISAIGMLYLILLQFLLRMKYSFSVIPLLLPIISQYIVISTQKSNH